MPKHYDPAIDQEDEWRTETSFKSDYDGTVVAAQFMYPANYAEGRQAVLRLTIQADDGDEVSAQYSLGRAGQWEIIDDGEEVVSAIGKKRFDPRGKYGLLIDTVRELDPRLSKEMHARGTPRRAEVWLGLRFHWKIRTERYEIDGRTIESNAPYPVRWLGIAGQQVAPAPSDASTSPAATSAGPEIYKKVAALADGKDRRGLARALALSEDPELSSDDVIEGVMNNSLLHRLESEGLITLVDGIYKQVPF